MPITLKVPIATAVVDDNPSCVLRAEFNDGIAFIYLDARQQDHRKVLGLPKRTKLHWTKGTREYEAQEISSFPWPIRYRVVTADAWYSDGEGNRVHYSPSIAGLDPFAKPIFYSSKRQVLALKEDTRPPVSLGTTFWRSRLGELL